MNSFFEVYFFWLPLLWPAIGGSVALAGQGKAGQQLPAVVVEVAQPAPLAEPQHQPLVHVADAKAVGDLQLYILIVQIGVQQRRVPAPAGIGHLHDEQPVFLPGADADGDARILSCNAVTDGVFHQQLEGEFGNDT